MPSGQKVSANVWDSTETDAGDDLENIGERTMVTAPSGMGSPMGGFMMDSDEPVDATRIPARLGEGRVRTVINAFHHFPLRSGLGGAVVSFSFL